MSNDDHNVDMDRYFNDPDYRKNVLGKKNRPDSEASQPQNKSNNRRLKKNILIYSSAAFVFFLAVGIGYFLYLVQGLPSIEELENPRTAIATEVRSSDGAVLDRYFIENRTYINIDEISPNAINALIATEDHRFFDHWGMDMFRTFSGVGQTILGKIGIPGFYTQGGSTISQQLARNLYRNIGFEVSVTRKLRELITAIQIENNYTKLEIIEMYLNTVEFSNSAFGIEQASRTHFGKSARDLTVSEAATLIGQLRAVYAYNPRFFPERAEFRRNVVLNLMYQREFISDEVFQNIRLEPIALNYQPPSRSGRESRYFGEYVRLQVQQWAL